MKKKKITQSIQRPLYWLSLVLIMLMGMMTEAQAGSSQKYYYKATAKVSPQGAGKVYIGEESTTSTDKYKEEFKIDNGEGTGAFSRFFGIDEPAQKILYLDALANDGYIFDHWAKESASGTSLGTSHSITQTITFKGSQSSPTPFTYYAVFKKQNGLVKVKVNSGEETMGTVSISNPDNVLDDEVTLTASPDVSNGVIFLGWTKDSGTEYVSNDLHYDLTVTNETAGMYVAHFEKASDVVYMRLQNKKTGRFISFYGNKDVVDHTRTYLNRTIKDGYKFTNSLKMISASEAQGNPETVFYRTGVAKGSGVTTNANLSVATGNTSYSTVSKGNPLTLERQADGTYHIYTTIKVSAEGQEANLNTYFCDEGGNQGWLVMKTTQSLPNFDQDEAKWIVYALDENTTEGAFGANTNAKFTRDGYYFTTMYTDFPYQLLDGVEAYYLTIQDHSYDQENNIVKFQKVTTGKVPANMAVVLKCKDVQNNFEQNKVVLNRLLPLDKNTVAQIVNDGDNLLNGYVSVNGTKVTNNKKSMYVLSYDNSLGFYHFNSDYMTPNKAYLYIRGANIDGSSVAATATFAFGDEDLDKISRIIMNDQFVDDDYAPIYDLQGRQMVGQLHKGIYISNGKKFVVK